MKYLPDLFDGGTISLFLLASGVTCLIAAMATSQTRKTGIPGPKGLPLIGNAHQMPSFRPWLVFSAWKKLYGNMIHLNVLGKSIIVINSAQVAQDLFEKRSSIYSDRPTLVMAELCDYHKLFVMLPYGDEWRNQRRLVAQDLSPSMTPRYYGLQETAARLLVRNLIAKPESLRSEVQLRIGMIILRVAYGYKVESRADPMLGMGLTLLKNFSVATAPGRWFVEVIPALRHIPKWFPGASFRNTADEWREIVKQGSHNPYYWCKENLGTGKMLSPSMCGRHLEEVGEDITEKQEYTLLWSAATLFGGGLDTSMSAVLTFFRAMILNPDVVVKAQEEIDRVVGKDRLPTIDDKPNLPYVRSVVAEVLRFAPSIPLGIPHAVAKDDYYNGYFFPKGSILFANIWHMTHDPEVYPEPERFNPYRFGGDDSEMKKVSDLVFGFGRRVCPGMEFEHGTLFAIVATTLATCDVLPGLDEKGCKVMPTTDYENVTIPMPEPYTLRLKPRSQDAARLLADVSTEIE